MAQTTKGGVVGFKRPRDERGIQDTRGFCLRPCAWPRCKTRQREVRLVQEFLFVLVNQSSTTTTQWANSCNFLLTFKDDFIDNILNSGMPIGLSSVWLAELYRLVTTYNILGKAGFTLDSPDGNRALINTLNDNMLSEEEDSPLLHHKNPSTLLPAKREGMKFARRLLLATWDSVLEILSAPLETSTSGLWPASFNHQWINQSNQCINIMTWDKVALTSKPECHV